MPYNLLLRQKNPGPPRRVVGDSTVDDASIILGPITFTVVEMSAVVRSTLTDYNCREIWTRNLKCVCYPWMHSRVSAAVYRDHLMHPI